MFTAIAIIGLLLAPPVGGDEKTILPAAEVKANQSSNAGASIEFCDFVEFGVPAGIVWMKGQAADSATCDKACEFAISLLSGEFGVPDTSFAHSLLRKRVAEGCLHAKRLLGRILVEGAGAPRDSESGKQLLLEAAEAGDAASWFALARLFSTGDYGVARDETKSSEYSRRAAEAGFLFAQVDFILLEIGNENDTSKVKAAIAKLTPIADSGFARAQAVLATIYAHGMGVTPDRTAAAKWAKLAAEQGEPLAFVIHGLDLADRSSSGSDDFRRGLMFIALAKRNGDRTAVGMYPKLFGEFGALVMKKADQDMLLFVPQPNQASREAIFAISSMPDGSLATEDLAELDQLELKAKAGDPSASAVVAEYYYRGAGRPKDRAHAAKLIEVSARAGNFISQRTLGYLYRFGCGVPASNLEAAFWLQLSVDGSPSGTMSSAVMAKQCFDALSQSEQAGVRKRVADFRPIRIGAGS